MDNDPGKGAYISIKNMKEIPMPVKLEITTISGKKIRKELPVEIWKKNISWRFKVDTEEALQQVVVEPDLEYPDIDSKNNYWYSTE